ncbi:gamma carbonic anhydrase family protein [Thaumasiovibrio sp. DFM-14]|uniref:gamma carbonic anhydrase family protein n=1 Tax=Thaumasiovibrio sp. DFM-14 TaxID=3384792 RepID=UPI00399F2548
METNVRPYKNNYPLLGQRVYLDSSAVVIGQVRVGDDSSIWPLVSIRGDVNCITIGQRSNIQDGSILHVTRTSEEDSQGFPLYIGDDVTVGHHATLHGCILKNRILIGMGSIVLDGAIIEDDVMLAAGSLVPPRKTLTSGFLYVGSPAKPARALTDKELTFLRQSANNYVVLKDEYLNEASG